MPRKSTIERAEQDRREGKAPTTQAGEFVREEIEHVREGKHGARSPQQAIAIGLSKARRAGVKLPPPGRNTSPRTRVQAARDSEKGDEKRSRPAPARSSAVTGALKREGGQAASSEALSRHSRAASRRRRTGREALVRTTGAEETVKKASRTTKRSTLQRKGPRREVPPLMSGFGGYTP